MANFLKFLNVWGRYEKIWVPLFLSTFPWVLSQSAFPVVPSVDFPLPEQHQKWMVLRIMQTDLHKMKITKSSLKFLWQQFQVIVVLSKDKYRLSIGSFLFFLFNSLHIGKWIKFSCDNWDFNKANFAMKIVTDIWKQTNKKKNPLR